MLYDWEDILSCRVCRRYEFGFAGRSRCVDYTKMLRSESVGK